MNNLFASVATERVIRSSIHFQGLPPQLGVKDARIRLQLPRFVAIIEENSGIFLYRFSADGRVLGDTWHRSTEEAKSQAVYEYGTALGAWIDLPNYVTYADMPTYGIELLTSMGDSSTT